MISVIIISVFALCGQCITFTLYYDVFCWKMYLWTLNQVKSWNSEKICYYFSCTGISHNVTDHFLITHVIFLIDNIERMYDSSPYGQFILVQVFFPFYFGLMISDIFFSSKFQTYKKNISLDTFIKCFNLAHKCVSPRIFSRSVCL